MTEGDGFGPAFRLLDPSRFDWDAAPAAARDWTAAEAGAWAEGVRLAAGVARRFAALVPEHAGPFAAFAVTLEKRADMGPAGAAPGIGWRPPAEQQQEPP